MNQTLSEQVKEAGQAALTAANASTEPTEDTSTQEGQEEGLESSSAEKPAYLSVLSDDEWNALGDKERAALIKTGKSLYGDYQNKVKDLGPERRIRAVLEEDKDLAEIIKAYQDGTLKPPSKNSQPATVQQVAQATSEAGDLIDELKANEDPAVRMQAAKLEAAIIRRLKAADNTGLKQEVEQLRSVVNSFKGFQAQTRQQEIEGKLSSLSPAWTPALEKHREKILVKATQYPNVSFDHLLMTTLSAEEYKTALKADIRSEEAQTVKKAKGSPTKTSSASGGDPLIGDKDVKRGAFGTARIDYKSVIGRMMPEMKKGIPK